MSPLRGFVVALAFLTRIPVARARPITSDELARAVPYYPTVGLVLGGLGAAIAVALPHLSRMLLALVLCAQSLVITGALHEDGLADSLDGLGGGATRERALEIMRDSRIGTFGAAGLVLFLLARFVLYQSIAPACLPWALVVAGCLSRFGFLPLMAFLAPARADGLAAAQGGRFGRRELAISALLPLVVGVAGGLASLAALAATLVVAGVVGRWLRVRLGGYTGDTLGLCACLCEVATLAVFVAA